MDTAKPDRLSLTRQCVHIICSYIQSNGLGATSMLPSVQDWGKILGVSTVVVREAFRSLEALGLVEIHHGRGIFLSTGQIIYLEAHEANEVGYHAAYLSAIRNRDLTNTRKLVDNHLIGMCTKYRVFPMIANQTGISQP